jgi:hypothetical protein
MVWPYPIDAGMAFANWLPVIAVVWLMRKSSLTCIHCLDFVSPKNQPEYFFKIKNFPWSISKRAQSGLIHLEKRLGCY